MSGGLLAGGIAALLVGGGTGVALGESGVVGSTETVAETVVSTQNRTVTRTTTVKKRIVKTVTEIIEVPSGGGGDGGGGDTSADDADGDGCSDSYEGACVDPSDGYNDVDCPDLYDTDFDSVGDDPYGLDADYDGVACES
jgi:hypothetical protein